MPDRRTRCFEVMLARACRESARDSGSDPVLEVGGLAVAEDALQSVPAGALRREPFGHVLRFQRNQATLMAGGGNLRRRVVAYRGK